MICAATYFTKRWCYCAESWLEHFSVAIRGKTGHLIVANDDSPECERIFGKIEKRMDQVGWGCHRVVITENDDNEPYKEKAQYVIAKMQQKTFAKGRELGATAFWSSEIDVMPMPNSLSVLMQMLEFDDGYYSIAMATYPNGLFLGGRGTPQEPICQDFYPEERNLPKELAELIKKQEKQKKDFLKKPPTKEELVKFSEDAQKISEGIRLAPPKMNIFSAQAKKWRKRGWMEFAYPGIGKGAVVPTDWVGLGCTLLNQKALDLAMYDGYDLMGTQDLYLCWKKWHPAGLRMCVVPHVACSHIKRTNGQKDSEPVYMEAAHEATGDAIGHLRQSERKYIKF